MEEPKYTDAETGDKFYLYDTFYCFNKINNAIYDHFVDPSFEDDYFKDTEEESKAFKNKDDCEIALGYFLLSKHEKMIKCCECGSDMLVIVLIRLNYK
jgi:hypothetical protein